MNVTRREFCQTSAAAALAGLVPPTISVAETSSGLILNKQQQLDRWSFWQNRDWDWYKTNLPFWESPHQQIDEIYYYRAQLLTKHLRYAAPGTGYIFTEFSNADHVPWAGRFNAIAASADLQLQEVRWLKTRQYAQDYARYWVTNDGAQPRNYGFAVAWATWQVGQTHGDQKLAVALLDEFLKNYEGWERGQVAYPHDNGFDPRRNLFWNTGRDMGGEFNLASCQLSEGLRGIPGYKIRGGAGYRPDINAVLFAEAETIAKIARLAGRSDVETRFSKKAAMLKMCTLHDLWDSQRQFFMHRWRYDEYSEGDTVDKKSILEWSLIWETNSDRSGGVGYKPQISGAGHGRELTGYIPWRYGLPEDNEEYASAWTFLTSRDYFYADYGPTTAEYNDPWFQVIQHACRHNGQSWPFHTSRVLSAAGNLLNDYQKRADFNRDKYFDLFQIYAKTQHKDGKPHIAEAHDPFSARWVQDEWPGLDYFHSSFIDLVITGLAGLRPGDGDTLTINPLAPSGWDYFALDQVEYRGHLISIFWDRSGERYKRGRGLTVLVDGTVVASSAEMRRLTLLLKSAIVKAQPYEVIVSANCEGAQFPKASASFTAKYDTPDAALDGLYWYDPEFGEKWTCRGSWTAEDWYQVDFGSEQTIAAIRLFLYADQFGVEAPESYFISYDRGGSWHPIVPAQTYPEKPTANRANTVSFAPLNTSKIQVTFRHKPGVGVGLAQLQALSLDTPRSGN